MNFYTSKYLKNGFTLIELAVVLVIISVILSTAISVASTRIDAQRMSNTFDRIALITSALQQYITTFDRLPCPADGLIAAPSPSNPAPAGYGIEVRVVGGNEDCADTSAGIDSSGDVYAGVLPHVALGLSPTAAIDGWENRFTYAVDKKYSFAGDAGLKTGYLGEEVAPTIIIRNGNTAAPPAGQITTTSVFLILSHGPNGAGAWPTRGVTRNAVPGAGLPLELENADFDVTFVQVSHREKFDDIIYYKNKWQIIDE